MRVTYTESGGLLGMPRTITVDSTALAAGDAATLLQLVHTANVLALEPPPPPPEKARDLRAFQLIVEEQEQRHELRFTDATMPAGVQPLIAWLTARARRADGS